MLLDDPLVDPLVLPLTDEVPPEAKIVSVARSASEHVM
jgi:hypothetical protein